MEENYSMNETDKFIPKQGDLRTLWLAALNCKKISPRTYQMVHLIITCEELSRGFHQLNLSMYSLFLIGTATVYERQCYYLYKDLDNLVYRFKETLNAHSILLKDSSKAGSRVTLPTESDLVLAAFNQLSMMGPSYTFLPDSEFFTMDDFNSEVTVANVMDITLPPSSDKSLSISNPINEPEFDFVNALPTSNQPTVTDNCDSSLVPLTTDNKTPEEKRPHMSSSKPLNPFVSPHDDDIGPLPDDVLQQQQALALNRKSVKRKLAFDMATELSDKNLANNAESWEDTLKKSAIARYGWKNANQLVSTPNDSTVYNHKDLLTLWQLTITPDNTTTEDVDTSYQHQETSQSIELMRVGPRSISGSDRWSGTGISMNASNSLNRDIQSKESSRHNRLNTLLGHHKGLSPIVDMEEDYLMSINDGPSLPTFKDDLLITLPALNDSKSFIFFKCHLVSIIGEREETTFSELVQSQSNSRLSSKRIASLTMMHVLELISQGILTPSQALPYQEIFIKRGRNF